MAKIFISYRREDNPVLAAQIRDAFAAHFGQSNLWMDTEFALPRMNFGEVLSEALFDCDVFIAILGEHWLDVLHSKAAQHDSDFVRVEIAAALKHKIPVIPVRVGREGQLLQMWRPSELPDDIRAMLNFQTTDVTRENFKDDIVALVNAVEAARRGLPLEPGEIVRPSADIERMPSASALPSDPLAYHSIDTLQRLRRAAAGAIVQTEQVGDRALSEQRLPYAEIAALREQLAEKERETARYRGVTEELAKDLHQARIAREEFERLRDENKHQFEQQREALRSERMELRREVEMQVTGRTAMSRMRHKRIGAVVVLVAASGIAYLFRDRLSDVSRMLIDSIGRLLSDFGVSKGAILPLSAVAITSPTPPDVVDCSVFAPPVVRSDSQFMIQVFLHLVEQSERVEFLATSMDGSAKFRGRQTLQVSVPRDTLLRVVLDGQGIDVLEPVHEFVWRGEP